MSDYVKTRSKKNSSVQSEEEVPLSPPAANAFTEEVKTCPTCGGIDFTVARSRKEQQDNDFLKELGVPMACRTLGTLRLSQVVNLLKKQGHGEATIDAVKTIRREQLDRCRKEKFLDARAAKKTNNA